MRGVLEIFRPKNYEDRALTSYRLRPRENLKIQSPEKLRKDGCLRYSSQNKCQDCLGYTKQIKSWPESPNPSWHCSE